MKKLKKASTSQNMKATANTQPKQKMRKGKVMNSIMICFLSLALIGGASVFFILIAVMQDAPDINSAMFNSTESTKLLDKNGEIYTSVGAENRENITYDQLPQTVVDAFLSIEDSRYFTHNGFDLPRFVSSALNNLKSGSLGQGGSTLTMQMIDNTRKTYDPEYDESSAGSIQRIKWKIQEIILSMKADYELSKEEILVSYLNKVNFGYTARGIQKGAQYYFGKDVTQLNLSESAFLAGVVNAPNLFNPYKGTQWSNNSESWINYYEYALDRRDDTLYQMWNHGYITEEEYKLAKSTELAFQLNGEDSFHPDNSQSYLNVVAKEASEKYGINIYTESCVVYTGLDPDAQKQADELSNADSITAAGVTAKIPTDDNYNYGFTMLNAKNGEIAAVGAGRDFNLDNGAVINQALEAHNTGSTIKPILDYAPAFDYLGYATSHTFSDVPMDIYGTGMVLRNSDGKYRGDVSFDETVGNSYNTTAAATLKELQATWGDNNIKDYLRKLGFSEETVKNFALQYSIGGSEMKASTTTLAAAYATLANQGQYIEPHAITKIEFPNDPDKETITPNYEPVQTLSSQAAYLMSDVLKKAVNINYFMKNCFPGVGYAVYGKTGTSDWGNIADRGNSHIPDGAIKDEWMVNYTSDYVIATWSGYEDPDYIRDDVLYQNIPGHINRVMLDTISSVQTPSAIAQPDGISTISHIKGRFPYTIPTEGMPDTSIITGMIRSDKAKLTTLDADDLKELASFNATVDASKNITLDFAAYPEEEKTKEASNTKNFNILGISFTGNVFYDPVFVFGRVVYKTEIKIDGNVVQAITSNDTKSSHALDANIPGGQKLQVCGFYAYERNGKTSNQKCVDVTTEADKPKVDFTPLNATLQNAGQYTDPTKYQQQYVDNLNNQLTKGNELLKKADATQDEVNAQIAAINAAIDLCTKNPVKSTQTPPTTPTTPTPTP